MPLFSSWRGLFRARCSTDANGTSHPLRRELVLTLLIKLLALIALQHWLMPARVSPSEAAQGLESRLAEPAPATQSTPTSLPNSSPKETS
jgi:Tfp pilus assembly protein PilX